jgi:hypothetical protein
MTSKTTTYMVKGSKRERFKTDNLAKIPGVEVSNKETRDIVDGRAKKRGSTQTMPYVDPASAPAAPRGEYTPPATRHNDLESQRPTLGIGIDAPAVEEPPSRGFGTNEYASPDYQGYQGPADAPLAFESDDRPTLAPEGAAFQPPWSSPTPVPTQREPTAQIPHAAAPTPQPHRGSGAIPFATPETPSAALQARTKQPTLRQVFLVVSFQGGTESMTLPGIQTPAHLPVFRIDSSFSTYDAAFAKAARLNREHAAQGRVFVVNAVNVPL